MTRRSPCVELVLLQVVSLMQVPLIVIVRVLVVLLSLAACSRSLWLHHLLHHRFQDIFVYARCTAVSSTVLLDTG